MFFFFNFSNSNNESEFAIWEAQGYAEEQGTLSPLPQGIYQWIFKNYEYAYVEFIHSSQASEFLSPLIHAGWKNFVIL